jgi:hypothetical protein
MDRHDVDRWLDAYVTAWKRYDRDAIAALFSDDVTYRYHPYDEPVRGRDAVVSTWLGEDGPDGPSDRDAEGTYDATYRTVAIDGDAAVATGHSVYRSAPGGPVERVFDNCFVMRFDENDPGLGGAQRFPGLGGAQRVRCREFTEWFMQRPT